MLSFRTIPLAVAAVLLVTAGAHTQPYRNAPYAIPLTAPGGSAGHPFAGGLYNPVHQFTDLDADGDRDLLLYDINDGSVQFYRNAGSPQSPLFRYEPGGLAVPPVRGWFRFADVTGDGFPDFLTGGDSLNSLALYVHTGLPGTATFMLSSSLLRDTSGVPVYVQEQCIPALADIDGDGDQDFFSLNPSIGTINHYENIGGSALFRPVFRTDFYQGIQICPGCGTPGERVLHGQGTMYFADVDADLDLDMFYGDLFDDGLFFYRNIGTPSAAVLDSVSGRFPPADPVITAGFNQPTLADLDGDGDPDLFVSVLPPFQARDNFYFYENIGTPPAPVFTLRTRNYLSMADVGLQSAPAAVDLDADGDMDLLVGDLNGRIALLRNTGSPSAPAFFWEDSAFLSSTTRFAFAPAAADLDGDGDPDLVVGTFTGTLEFHRNTGTPQAPVFSRELSWFDSLTAGGYAAPAFFDADGDGHPDLFLGSAAGRVAFFRNTGGPAGPRFEPVSAAFAGIQVPGNAKPAFGDADGDGRADLIVGSASGGVYVYRNEGGTGVPAFTLLPGYFIAGEAMRESAPAPADMDGDGDADLLLGQLRGGLFYYRREGSTAVADPGPPRGIPEAIRLTASPNPFNGSTTLGFTLPDAGPVRISLVDAAGRLVDVPFAGDLPRGDHRLLLSLEGRASGMYLVRLGARTRTGAARILLVR